MENMKLNLSSQVSFLEIKNINNETNQLNSASNNHSKEILYYFLYDDQINKKLMIHQIKYNNEIKFNNISSIEQKIKYELKYKEDIGNDDIHLIAKGNIDNKIYLIFISDNNIYNIYAGIFDTEIDKYFPIIIENSSKLKEIINQLPDKDYITIFEQNKIFFFGGLIDQSKKRNNTLSQITTQMSNEEESKQISSINDFLLNKSCIYFDIEKLDFEKQKFPENSLIPRYKLGGTCENSIIYLIGGFTSYINNHENDDNICNNLQFSKFFDDKMYQFSIAKFDGENPKDMADSDILFINNRFIVSFSGYKYSKIWILDIKTNIGVNYDLKEKIKLEEFNKDNIFLRMINCDINENNNEINLIIAKIIFNDVNKDIKFDIINRIFQINIGSN